MKHPAALDEAELLRQCDIRRQRRSGPGGQHRNKVETAIFIEHRPTGVTAEACERRSQEANRQQAIFRLRVNLALEFRCQGENEPPSQLWRSRCRGGRIAVNVEHADFPSLLAEALDQLQSHRWEAKPAAESLACSSSQLIKLLQKEPKALTLLNERRAAEGLKAYQ